MPRGLSESFNINNQWKNLWTQAKADGVTVSGGIAYTYSAGTVNTTGETDPAPEPVYRNSRYTLDANNINATLFNLTPDREYMIRTHHWSHAGELLAGCTMKCTANGVEKFTTVMSFGADGAYIEEFSIAADEAGEILLEFAKVVSGATLNGVELIP